ncbi:hypothetical protein M404DRAFT_17852 [Pisolithus tinctorius Marx 270]|uniref:Retrotransposon gag domain-containing protein n=1 Tax=Pisolithus tinctorius Marx 270 TaxID=870435 RepID=A0A0C3PL61_PISTI|nr:hypothetical protein M404DRAFT_17852 [Pisolithus tinctorius Marx 270]
MAPGDSPILIDIEKTSLEKNPPSFGSFADFMKDFKNSFTSSDTAGTAITKLHTMKQKDSVEQYITNFRTAATDSTIMEDVALHDGNHSYKGH